MFGSLSVKRNGGRELLSTEVLKNPNSTLGDDARDTLLSEIEVSVSESWGKFSEEYLKKSVLSAYLLCLIRNKKGEIIALAPVKKIQINGRNIYSFGLTVVHPGYRRLGLLKKMGLRLARAVVFENVIRGIFTIEVVFITPNIWTIGIVARRAEFIYPNPYKIKENGTIDEADDETWDTINKYLKLTGENFRSLDRVGSVMEGFYDDKEELIVSERKHKDKPLNVFSSKYLYASKGREIVVRAKINLLTVLFKRR